MTFLHVPWLGKDITRVRTENTILVEDIYHSKNRNVVVTKSMLFQFNAGHTLLL